MQTEDYLMRQFNQLGRVLGKILADLLGLENKGNVKDLAGTVSQEMKEQLDLDIDELADLPEDGFVEFLKNEKGFSDEHLSQLADILFIIAENTSDPKLMNGLYLKCLVIYLFLEEEEKVFSLERNERIGRIRWFLGR